MADRPVAQHPPVEPTRQLRALTPARVGLARSGASLATSEMLAFAADHARARDAVHQAFDADAIVAGVASLGLGVCTVQSRARHRGDYLRRPDLGRRLAPLSEGALDTQPDRGCDLAVVIGDGLSAAAVHAHAVPLLADLLPRFGDMVLGPVVIATGARVALGDEIGARLGARLTLMLIGERPGLTTPDSLGAYLTYAPPVGLTDADRNCVSNIHRGGLSYPQAAARIAWLVREALSRGISGVALKDDSGLVAMPELAPRVM